MKKRKLNVLLRSSRLVADAYVDYAVKRVEVVVQDKLGNELGRGPGFGYGTRRIKGTATLTKTGVAEYGKVLLDDKTIVGDVIDGGINAVPGDSVELTFDIKQVEDYMLKRRYR